MSRRQKIEVRSWKLEVRSRKLEAVWRGVLTFCLLTSTFYLLSCGSIPNLEQPECTDSRFVVKEFYSYHFGNEMKFSEDPSRRWP